MLEKPTINIILPANIQLAQNNGNVQTQGVQQEKGKLTQSSGQEVKQNAEGTNTDESELQEILGVLDKLSKSLKNKGNTQGAIQEGPEKADRPGDKNINSMLDGLGIKNTGNIKSDLDAIIDAYKQNGFKPIKPGNNGGDAYITQMLQSLGLQDQGSIERNLQAIADYYMKQEQQQGQTQAAANPTVAPATTTPTQTAVQTPTQPTGTVAPQPAAASGYQQTGAVYGQPAQAGYQQAGAVYGQPVQAGYQQAAGAAYPSTNLAIANAQQGAQGTAAPFTQYPITNNFYYPGPVQVNQQPGASPAINVGPIQPQMAQPAQVQQVQQPVAAAVQQPVVALPQQQQLPQQPVIASQIPSISLAQSFNYLPQPQQGITQPVATTTAMPTTPAVQQAGTYAAPAALGYPVAGAQNNLAAPLQTPKINMGQGFLVGQ